MAGTAMDSKQRVAALGVLVVALWCVGTALLPFSYRVPYRAGVDCSAPIVQAFRSSSGRPAEGATRGLDAFLPEGTRTAGTFVAAVPATLCHPKAVRRLYSTVVVLMLTGLGGVLAWRLTAGEVPPANRALA